MRGVRRPGFSGNSPRPCTSRKRSADTARGKLRGGWTVGSVTETTGYREDDVLANRTGHIWALLAERAGPRAATVEDVCSTCVELVACAGGCVVLGSSGGTRSGALHATGPLSRDIEDAQLTLGQGPSVAALAAGEPVLAPDLAAAEAHRRWPAFAPSALDMGVHAVFAFPLAVGAIRLGALSLHHTAAKPLGAEAFADALICAEIAVNLILKDDFPKADAEERIDALFTGQAEVHQATGMVAAQLDVGIEEAFIRLRAYAFRYERRLGDVASEVVARHLRFSPDPGPPPVPDI